MALHNWAPFGELDRFRKDFDNLFDRFLGGKTEFAAGKLALAVESYIDEGKLVIRADLPGIDPKDVEITATGDQLTIRGKREKKTEEENKNYLYREVVYGSFERTMRLPEGARSDAIKATYRNGVLELSMPLPERSQARKVPIEIEREP